ncbi:outer membrane chaperone Skp/OmpH [Candidatus Moduliflexus flocculans]|uniref:Outer membrane chaperone Skp/OmpH n=1 Tax=Candidatus Moduliflexus flocculans TaxID=1499966 RepID=A0A0S6VQY3_9BACT|nr:outer membrane chaperone Skp/OmpH [Candidatus Moduliflexus flocculans]
MMMVAMIGAIAGNVFAQGETMKIGFVDLQRVIDSSEQGKAAQDEVKKKSDELTEQAKKMEDEYNKMKADFDNQQAMLTPEAKNQKRDELAKFERDYTRFVQDSRNELRQVEQRSLKQLLEDVGKIVVEYGKNNNFTLILEAGNILYGADQIEITADIIKLYNTKGSK